MKLFTETCVVCIGLAVMLATFAFGIVNFFIPIFTAFIEAPGFGILFLSLIKLGVSTFIGTLVIILEFMVTLWMFSIANM